MSQQRILKSKPQNPPVGTTVSTDLQNASSRQPNHEKGNPTPQESENESFAQDRFEATGLQLKEKHGRLSPVQQARLGALQAKMDSFWVQRTERAKAEPNLLATTKLSRRSLQTTPTIAAPRSVQPDIRQADTAQYRDNDHEGGERENTDTVVDNDTVGSENRKSQRENLPVLQPSASPKAVSPQKETNLLVQRDKTADQIKALDARTKVLEQKTAALQLDLKYRALFGEKISTYKQVTYRLTGAFQAAVNGYQGAQGKQAAQDAVIDQVVTTIILVAGAAALEPFLTFSLGKLQPVLGKASQKIAAMDIKAVVEKLENPINAGASGAGNAVTTKRAGDRAAGAQAGGIPGGGGAGAGGGDPLSFLAANMEAIESHTQKFEAAFSERASKYDTLSAEEWEGWNKDAQEATYNSLLKDLDNVALSDINKLEGPNTLAAKIELYLWAAWIKSHTPGVSGLQIGSQLATRLKDLGVESLANVKFDTKSWIFMDHEPPKGGWETNLRNWAAGWSQPLTK